MKRLSIIFYYLILIVVVAACTKDELHEPIDQDGLNQNTIYQGNINPEQVRQEMQSEEKLNR